MSPLTMRYMFVRFRSQVVCPRLGQRRHSRDGVFQALRGRYVPRLHVEDGGLQRVSVWYRLHQKANNRVLIIEYLVGFFTFFVSLSFLGTLVFQNNRDCCICYRFLGEHEDVDFMEILEFIASPLCFLDHLCLSVTHLEIFSFSLMSSMLLKPF